MNEWPQRYPYGRISCFFACPSPFLSVLVPFLRVAATSVTGGLRQKAETVNEGKFDWPVEHVAASNSAEEMNNEKSLYNLQNMAAAVCLHVSIHYFTPSCPFFFFFPMFCLIIYLGAV